MPFVIGLTGGIGSGKSTVAEMFSELGAGVVDTDRIAHELTGPGGAALGAIALRFGERFLTPNGGMDRELMRSLIFSDPDAKSDLEAILHPLIRTESARRVAESAAPYILLVVPLLFETGKDPERFQRVLVVDCEEQTQLERVVSRSGLHPEQVHAIMENQVPRAQRVAGADDLIRNEGDMAGLRAQILPLHRKYLELAAQAARPVGNDRP